MRTSGSSSRAGLLAAASLSVLLVVIGVVMADTHEPVAIEPDATRPAGVHVATFALG